MWVLRLIRATWCIAVIFYSYMLFGLRRRLFPRSARLPARRAKLHERNARRARRMCTKLGGIYIKLGQVLSVMGTFLPPVYVAELEQLQDAVPPRPYRVIRRALRRRLGRPPEELFASFDRVPVAAASLGQVHKAMTHAGTSVAVKVLYPNVRALMIIDMRVLRLAAAFYKRFFVKVEQLNRVLDQLEEMLERETNLEHEAECIARMNRHFRSDPDVVLPRVLPELSNRRVLTMTFMEGVKITDREALLALGLEPSAVVTKLVSTFCKSLFIDRFFHADPHPGNFFVLRGEAGQPRLVMLDLGSASEIPRHLADGLAEVIEGFLKKDAGILMRGFERMGFVAENGDRDLLERVIHHYFKQILSLDIGDFSNVDDELAQKVREPDLDKEQVQVLLRSIAYPLGWFYIERAALILFGLSAQLAPKLNIVQTGFPYIAKFLAERAAREQQQGRPHQSTAPGIAHARALATRQEG